jgi:hypothetical protein
MGNMGSTFDQTRAPKPSQEKNATQNKPERTRHATIVDSPQERPPVVALCRPYTKHTEPPIINSIPTKSMLRNVRHLLLSEVFVLAGQTKKMDAMVITQNGRFI